MPKLVKVTAACAGTAVASGTLAFGGAVIEKRMVPDTK